MVEFLLTSAGKLTRKTSFPIKVSRIYSCDWHHFPVSSYTHGQYSVVLRYDSDSKLCRDIINGKVMGIPYPNVVFKFPGMKISFTDDSPRSTIGFSYPAEVIKLLHSWGMFPKEPFLPLTTTPELKRLIGEFIKLSRIFPKLPIAYSSQGVHFNNTAALEKAYAFTSSAVAFFLQIWPGVTP